MITYGIIADYIKDNEKVIKVLRDIVDSVGDSDCQIIMMGCKDEAYYESLEDGTREIIIFEAQDLTLTEKEKLINDHAKYKTIEIIHVE